SADAAPDSWRCRRSRKERGCPGREWRHTRETRSLRRRCRRRPATAAIGVVFRALPRARDARRRYSAPALLHLLVPFLVAAWFIVVVGILVFLRVLLDLFLFFFLVVVFFVLVIRFEFERLERHDAQIA